MSRYKPNHSKKDGLGGFLLSKQLAGPVKEVAQDVAKLAKVYSPRSQGPGPHMADQFKVRRVAATKVAGNLRVTYEIINSDIAAPLNEFGAKNNNAVRMLGRAGAFFGDYHGSMEE